MFVYGMFKKTGGSSPHEERGCGMDRWNRLFEQLESEHELAAQMERQETATQIAKAEIKQLTITDRLRAHFGRSLTVQLDSGELESGQLVESHTEWILLSMQNTSVIIPLWNVTAFIELTQKVAISTEHNGVQEPPSSAQEGMLARLNNKVGNYADVKFRRALESLAQDRQVVSVWTSQTPTHGLLNGVAADHANVMPVYNEQQRRSGIRQDTTTVMINKIRKITIRSYR